MIQKRPHDAKLTPKRGTTWQPLLHSTRANPFPKVTGLICRLPLPTLFISNRGCSPWGPDAVMGTGWDKRIRAHLPFNKERQDATRFSRSTGINPNTGRMGLCSTMIVNRPLLPANGFQGRHGVKQKRDLCKGITSAASLVQQKHCVNIIAQVQESLPASLSPVSSNCQMA